MFIKLSESGKEPSKQWGSWSMCPARGSWGEWDCPAWRRDGFGGPDRSRLVPAWTLSRRQSQALFAGAQQEKKRNGHNVKEGMLWVTKEKKVHHEGSQALELARSPSSEVFETQLDKALSNLVLNSVSALLWAGGWTKDLLKYSTKISHKK